MPEHLINGATKGLLICSDVIIPSLFPFTAVAIFLFNCGFMHYMERIVNPLSRKITGLNGEAFCIVLMSFVGGFPVGAKLIDELVAKGSITEKTATRMLCYCVNPGPAFIIIGIGQTMLKSTSIGVILYFSNIISSFIICLILSFKERREFSAKENKINRTENISNLFVKSVSDASSSIIGICGFVILFSSLLGILANTKNIILPKELLALLEISNGTLLSNNIYFLSFLTAFSGFCVHMQILTVCKNFRVPYYKFLLSRIMCGIISSFLTIILLKVFRITVPVISLNQNMPFYLSGVSLPLSAALIFMSITLLVSIKQNNVEKYRKVCYN